MSEIDSWVSENLSAIARSLEKCLTDQSGQEIGFVLLLCPFEHLPTNVQYVSNVAREQATPLLATLLNRWQTGQEDIAHLQRN